VLQRRCSSPDHLQLIVRALAGVVVAFEGPLRLGNTLQALNGRCSLQGQITFPHPYPSHSRCYRSNIIKMEQTTSALLRWTAHDKKGSISIEHLWVDITVVLFEA
jgi:hypothetical protein